MFFLLQENHSRLPSSARFWEIKANFYCEFIKYYHKKWIQSVCKISFTITSIDGNCQFLDNNFLFFSFKSTFTKLIETKNWIEIIKNKNVFNQKLFWIKKQAWVLIFFSETISIWNNSFQVRQSAAKQNTLQSVLFDR